MATVSITLALDKAMHDGMARRAQAMGKRFNDYARQLIEAAYAVRVGMEKGFPASDHELDQAVRAVFCLAGEHNPKSIARATGWPEGLVRDVLKGFSIVAPTLAHASSPLAGEVAAKRTEGGGAVGRAEQAAPPTPGPAGRPSDPRKGEGTTRADGGYPVETIRRMWADGATVGAIAAAIGKTRGAFQMWAAKHRDVCPERGKDWLRGKARPARKGGGS